jgi:sulfofructose kinase
VASEELAARAGNTRVICLGLSALDQIWRVQDFFSGDSQKIRSLEYTTAGGGMAATAAVAVARLGGRAAFWGRGGEDAAGREMRHALAEQGVDVAQFRLFANGQSSVSGILVDMRGERQIVNFRGQFPEQADWLPLGQLATTSAVLADPRWVDGAVALFAAARAKTISTILDADVADRHVFEALLPLTDHAVFSEPALAGFAGSADDAALAGLARFGCSTRSKLNCSVASASIMRLRAPSSLIAPGQIVAHRVDAIERASIDVAPFQRVVRIAPPLLQRSGRAPDDRGYFQCRQIRAARQRIDIEHRRRRHATVLATALHSTRHFAIAWQPNT